MHPFIPSYYTPHLVIRWWNLNAIDFQAGDRKLAKSRRENGRNIALAAAEAEAGGTAERALADVLDRRETKKEVPKRPAKEVLKMLEPPQHVAKVQEEDEDEIE